MKTHHVIRALILFCVLGCSCKADITSKFYDGLDALEAEYRIGKAEELKKAVRVVVYLVDFETFTDDNPFVDEKKVMSVSAYGNKVKILKTKELTEDERKMFLLEFANQVAKPKHSGGAMCHFPIHGVRVYSKDDLLHEGTFCWVCQNFSFSYPQGSSWLDTNDALKKALTTLLPIPEAELKRFYEKYPGTKK